MNQAAVTTTCVLLCTITFSAMVGCNSNTAAEPEKQQNTKVVTDGTEPPKSGNPADESGPRRPQRTGSGTAAREKAAEADKYLFALFLKEENDQTVAMRRVLEEAMEKVADRADSVEVNITDASEKTLVDEFGLDYAPMPLILALAPNGAVTGGFPKQVKTQQLLEAFASPCMEKCMKRLQENKLVFLCVQNASTASSDAAMEGVRRFKADARFAQATEIVMLDPADAAEARFLEDLQVDPGTKEAVTVFLAPGGALAMYEGPTDKDELVATLQKASSACGPGSCGPGGCPPRE